MAKRKPKKPAPKKSAKKKPAPAKKPAKPVQKKPAKKPAKPVKKKPAKKPAAPARKVEFVRKDSRGRFLDQKGRPVAASRAKQFKSFFDASGRRRSMKSGLFAKGAAIAPTKKRARRKGVVSAFKPSRAVARGAAQEKLLKKRKRRGGPKVVDMRYTGRRRTEELARMFGIDLRTRGDFAVLIEAQGRELARGSFGVSDPIGTREDLTILRGVERVWRNEVRGISPAQVVAIQVTVSVEGEQVGAQTLITRSDERSEAVGGIMASIFSALGEAGLDASDGEDSNLEPVSDLEVEIVVFEIQ